MAQIFWIPAFRLSALCKYRVLIDKMNLTTGETRSLILFRCARGALLAVAFKIAVPGYLFVAQPRHIAP